MKIKWCVSDIDGTLTNSNKELDQRIIDAIHQYEKSGGTFILATGRTMLTAREMIDRIAINTPVICGNGSMIQYRSGKILLSHKILKEASQSVTDYAVANSFDFVAFSDNAVWCPYNSARIENLKKRNREEHNNKLNLIEFASAHELPHGEIIKFFIWDMGEKTVDDLELNCNVNKAMNFVQSVKGALDIDPIQASKGNGLRFLANHLNMQLKNTAAFGDNINDLDMLQAVGFPVAVGNAEDELKQAAWRVCPSNDECGVAVMLEEFMREHN